MTENALISRRVFSIDKGRVVIEEKWNTDHPDCPFVLYKGGLMENPHIRQIVMTQQQYNEIKPPIKP